MKRRGILWNTRPPKSPDGGLADAQSQLICRGLEKSEWLIKEEHRFKADMVDIKLIRDLKNRSLSVGEGDGGRGPVNRIYRVQECVARNDK